MSDLYPLRFGEILRAYGFGGRWIAEAFGDAKNLPAEGVIAETWEVCCRPKECSVVANGPLAGTSLRDLIARQPEPLLGDRIVRRFGPRFPLLIKFLDVTRTLGEQIHPNDEQAPKVSRPGFEGDPGKTEAWYMVFTRPGATIHCGNRAGLTARDVGAAVRAGTAPACMKEQAVRPGDAFLLYAGTMHYSAGGVLFYEIMQNSDATLSLRNWGPDRPAEETDRRVRLIQESVHLEDGADFRTVPVTLADGANRRTWVFACTQFALERLDLAEPHRLAADGGRFCVLTQIAGRTRVESAGGAETLAAGNSCLLPACLTETTLVPEGSGGSVLIAYVPDLPGDIIEPLRRAGVSDERIAGLGARTALNPLTRLLQ